MLRLEFVREMVATSAVAVSPRPPPSLLIQMKSRSPGRGSAACSGGRFLLRMPPCLMLFRERSVEDVVPSHWDASVGTTFPPGAASELTFTKKLRLPAIIAELFM